MPAIEVVGKALKKIFGSRNERLLRRYGRVADQIELLEPELRGDYDERFNARIRQLVEAGELPAEIDQTPMARLAWSAGRIEELERRELAPPGLAAKVQEVRKELSRPLAAKAQEIKWRLAPPEPLEQIVPEAYRLSPAEKWERLVFNGEPLEPALPADLRHRAAEIQARIERGESLQGLVPAECLEADVERWKARLAKGEAFESFLPAELRDRAEEFRLRMAPAEPVDEHLPMAFALVREASRRVQEHRHFHCQLIGGQVLYHGCVAEMKTGEGKTIVCHLAAFLKFLEGLKVHIVTVNDYLVRRDAEFARPIFDLLGATVGYIQSDVDPGGYEGIRKAQYACDVTYGTNNEFGFDYLRDNMKMRASDQVQGRLDYAIVDEVDSILIDEARTPLIISGPARGDPNDYKAADDYALALVEEQKRVNAETRQRIAEWDRRGVPEEFRKHPKFEDAFKRFKVDPYMLTEDEAEAIGHRQYFVVQRDRKQVHLTHEGVELAAKKSGLGSFYVEENMNWPHLIENALRARVVYERDKDYVVQNREVVIVDEFTGRLMHGRQWSDGLHQAVEAKHRNEAEIKRETQTLATITLQNYFKLYTSLAGMTGTAMTESDEFMKIYKLEVVEIPTNRPVNRNEHNDRIYKTTHDKYAAIVDEIYHMHRRGRPNDPFLLATIFERLLPICRAHQPQDVPKLEEALRRFNAAENQDPNVIDFMCETYDAVMGELAMGRPILVGTTSVENSEMLRGQLLRTYPQDFPPKAAKSKENEGLEVLNAKYHEREAEIVALAGQRYESKSARHRLGRVTIATNMAGRGTDIKLEPEVVYAKCKGSLAYEPDVERQARRPLFWRERNPDGTPKVGTKCCIHCPDYDGVCAHCWKPRLDPRFPELGRKICPLNAPCGLHIVGTERHEARRIDNQLRGRSGRQGDPGSARFFLSLEDDLLKLFMPDWMLKMMEKLGFVEGVSLEDRRISKGIERAQKKVEERNFSTRKHLLEWDEPMDFQRKAFYRERQRVLTARTESGLVRKMIDDAVEEAARRFLSEDYAAESVANFCRDSLKLDISAHSLAGLEPGEMQKVIRDALLDKVRDDVTNVIGEYIDPDLPPEEWDVRGLSRWAATLGASVTENQLRRMAPDDIEQMLLESGEKHAEEVSLDWVEAYVDPDRGLHDLVFWANRTFGLAIELGRLPSREPATVRAHLREQIHSAYDRRRAVFPVEWIIEEAYARPAHAGGHDIRSGHAITAGWANAKYACRWTPESIEQTYGSDIQKIGDALLALQYEYLMPKDGEGPLAREVDQAIERCAGKPAKLRQWARERFRDALDESIFDTAQAGTANLRAALIETGREWLCWEFNRFECALLLRSYDEAWMDHLLEMDHLKYAIMQRPLGGDQTHPQSQYAIEGREYFEKMWGRIRGLVLDRILRVRPSGAVEGRSIYQAVEVRHDEAVGAGFKGVTGVEPQPGLEAQGEVRVTEPIRRTQPRVKPNDPCPCGSGKKYKKCHGSRAAKM